MIIDETWADIPGYEGLYQVSDRGNIKAIYLSATGRKPGRQIKPHLMQTGYTNVTLYRNSRARTVCIHVIVMSAFVGPRPSANIQINHKNGNKSDNNLQNLEYVTSSENNYHRYRVLNAPKRDQRGESNNKAKLTECDVRDIRQMIRDGISVHDIALQFKVSVSTIYSVKHYQNWKHIK